MVYKIIADSCCDLTDKYRKDPHFQIIPLTLQVGSHSFIDDETFDQKEYIRLVAESPECASTAIFLSLLIDLYNKYSISSFPSDQLNSSSSTYLSFE